ncbi:hypothetical protein K3495_g6291 [Podosphaera aphanis]|nr:hypothetical protein K3495_g6291 [Podosphaera aphanis]
MTAIPSIACLAVIGKNNNPLHITTFPCATGVLSPLQTSFLLAATLDIFHARAAANHTTGGGLSGDYGLLHAVDERLAAYGYETNTAVRFVALVHMQGRHVQDEIDEPRRPPAEARGLGLREGELRAVFRAMQNAYVRLLQNPFFDPDEYVGGPGAASKRITSPRFVEEIRRIGEKWMPEGLTA